MKLKYQIGIFLGLIVLFAFFFKNSLTTFLASSTATINFISVFGTIVTIASFIYALNERDTRKQLEEKRRSQLWASIDRARYIMFDHNIIKDIQEKLDHKDKHRIWLTHQAACDLYISLIEQYLTIVDSFTYKDLENLCKNQGIFWKWQERQWRILICQRPENKNIEPPDFFVKTELSPYLQEKQDQQRFM